MAQDSLPSSPLEQVFHGHMLTGSSDTGTGELGGGSGRQATQQKMLF